MFRNRASLTPSYPQRAAALKVKQHEGNQINMITGFRQSTEVHVHLMYLKSPRPVQTGGSSHAACRRTFTFPRDGVSVRVGGAGGGAGAHVQRGLGVLAGVAVVGVRAVAQRAVGVAARTRPLLPVLEEALGTVGHTRSLVEEVMLLTACTEDGGQHGATT